MDRHTIWESPSFRISQSYSYPLPGYLFVEALADARRLDRLSPDTRRELGEVLALAEHLVTSIVAPERVYILKFGESDELAHFHVIPRTRRLLDAYLASEADTAPYNGARITAWLWANGAKLNHPSAEADAFVAAARVECLHWETMLSG